MKLKVCLVIAPFKNPNDAQSRITDFLRWLEPLAEEIYIVTGGFSFQTINGDKIQIVNVKHDRKNRGLLIQAIKHAFLQLNISIHLIKPALTSQLVIYWLSGIFILPMLLTKLLRKKLLIFITGSWADGIKHDSHYQRIRFGVSNILYRSVRTLEGISYILADRIVLLSPSLREQVRELAGDRCLKKCLVAPARPVNNAIFNVKKPLKERGRLIGYAGRLDEAKGLVELIEAFRILLQRYKKDDIEFIIIGDGPLASDLTAMAQRNGLEKNVLFTRWVTSDKVADYLNEMKLLVLPSATEGFPVIIYEAMACGTPVLATAVGAVHDAISDGETGFLMDNNSPECIAKNIIRALNDPNLEQITENARALVEKEFTYEAAVERYREILNQLSVK